MALVKCPDCGKQISSRASSCPSCGCPASFFNQRESMSEDDSITIESVAGVDSTQKGDYVEKTEITSNQLDFGNMKTITLLEHEFRYPDGGEKFYSLFGAFATEVEGIFNNATKMDSLKVINNYVNQETRNVVGRLIKALYSYGIVLSEEEFSNKYGLITKQNEGFERFISTKTTSINKARIIENDSPTTYQDIVNDDCVQIYDVIWDCFFAFCKELKEHGFKVIRFDYKGAKDLFDNTIKYENDSTKAQENILKCIEMFPGLKKYYESIYKALIKGDNILEFSSFVNQWHIKNFFKDIDSEIEKQRAEKKIIDTLIQRGFEFGDYSLENADKARKIVFENYLVDDGYLEIGKIPEIIKEYFHGFYSNNHDNQELFDRYLDYSSFDQYAVSLKNDGLLYGNAGCLLWIVGDKLRTNKTTGDFATEKPSDYEVAKAPTDQVIKRLNYDGEHILFYLDIEAGDGKKGIVITENYVYSLKYMNRLFLSEVGCIEVIKNDQYECVKISGKGSSITVVDDSLGLINSLYYIKSLVSSFIKHRDSIAFPVTKDVKIFDLSQSYADSIYKTICYSCGQQVDSNLKRCIYCGAILQHYYPEENTYYKNSDDLTVENMTYVHNEIKKICSNCGKQVSNDVKFCNYCGNPF